jgi:hypothetical protein
LIRKPRLPRLLSRRHKRLRMPLNLKRRKSKEPNSRRTTTELLPLMMELLKPCRNSMIECPRKVIQPSVLLMKKLKKKI